MGLEAGIEAIVKNTIMFKLIKLIDVICSAVFLIKLFQQMMGKIIRPFDTPVKRFFCFFIFYEVRLNIAKLGADEAAIRSKTLLTCEKGNYNVVSND